MSNARFPAMTRAMAIREYKAILKLVGSTNNNSVAIMLDYAIKLKEYFNL